MTSKNNIPVVHSPQLTTWDANGTNNYLETPEENKKALNMEFKKEKQDFNFNFSDLELSTVDFNDKYARQCYLFGFLVGQGKGEYKSLKTVFTKKTDITLLEALKDKVAFTKNFVEGHELGFAAIDNSVISPEENIRQLKEMLKNEHRSEKKLAIIKYLNVVMGITEILPNGSHRRTGK